MGCRSSEGNLPLGGATLAFRDGIRHPGLQYAAVGCDRCRAGRSERDDD